MNENPILYDVVEIIQHLKKLKTKEKKKEYLLFLREEFSDICYYYTDDGIEKYLEEHKLTDKYKPEKYNQFTDFDRTHISKSKYRSFLRDLEKILDYIQDQMVDNYLEEKRKENKIYRDYKTFNYDVQKVLDYSNELDDDKIPYLLWILKRFYDETLEKINKQPPVPEKNGKHISPEVSILRSDFFTKIKQRIEILKENPNIKVYKSMNNFAKDFKKTKYEHLSKNNKELLNFEFDKIKEHANKIEDLNERLLYLEWVKKEEAQNRVNVQTDYFEVPFVEKINAEIEYVKKAIEIKNKKEENKITTNESGDKKTEKKLTEGNTKVQWKGEDTDLYYMLNELEKSGFITKIDKEKFIKIIKEHFTDKYGKPFKNKRTTQGFNNLLNNKGYKSKNAHKIDKTIERIKSKIKQ